MVEHSDEVTGFFSLPRELRDSIYELVRKHHRRFVNDITFDFCVTIPEKRLVSRQFKLEYDQRSAANTYMYLLDPLDMCTFEHFPRLATNLSSLVLVWSSAVNENDIPMRPSFSPRVGLPLKARLNSLEELVSHIPQINDLHIQLEHCATHDLKDVVHDLIACPVLTRFFVRSGETLRDTIFGPIKKERATFAIWTRELGFLIDNTDEGRAKRRLNAARKRLAKRDAKHVRRS